jgi:hypothetical protein
MSVTKMKRNWDWITLLLVGIAIAILTAKLLVIYGQEEEDIEDRELALVTLGYDHIHEDEVAEFAANHSVTLERFDVETLSVTSERIEVVFGDVQTDELFEDRTADWLGSQGYGMLRYDPYNNGTTFLEFTTLP